jgi:hypothetical protein
MLAYLWKPQRHGMSVSTDTSLVHFLRHAWRFAHRSFHVALPKAALLNQIRIMHNT